MQFLRLQQKLQESQQPAAHLQRPPASMMDNQAPANVYSMMPPEADAMQLRLQQQQQNLQMMLNSQPQLPQQPPMQQQMQAAASLQQQQLMRHNSQYSQSMSPFQPPRQMTVATNYIYQQNMAAAKGQLQPQQLYYQNVQNFYYNQP